MPWRFWTRKESAMFSSKGPSNFEKGSEKTGHPFLVFLAFFFLVLTVFTVFKIKKIKTPSTQETQIVSEKKAEIEARKAEEAARKEEEKRAALASLRALEFQSSAEEEDPSDEDPPLEGEGIFAGEAMARADTGEVRQNAHGKGKNHNLRSSRYAYPASEVKAAMAGEKILDGPERIAFLTYDDGVSSVSTPLLLKELEKEQVPATFFMVGNSLTEKNKDLLLKMMKDGHALAIHSYDHTYSSLYPGRIADPKEIVRQAKFCRSRLEELLGEDFETHLWRYPGGHMSWKKMAPADQALAQLSFDWIDWNSMCGDASRKEDTPTTIQGQVDHILHDWAAFGKPNVLTILMHDTANKPLTRESLHAIVEALREEGFSFGILE